MFFERGGEKKKKMHKSFGSGRCVTAGQFCKYTHTCWAEQPWCGPRNLMVLDSSPIQESFNVSFSSTTELNFAILSTLTYVTKEEEVFSIF